MKERTIAGYLNCSWTVVSVRSELGVCTQAWGLVHGWMVSPNNRTKLRENDRSDRATYTWRLVLTSHLDRHLLLILMACELSFVTCIFESGPKPFHTDYWCYRGIIFVGFEEWSHK